jgi:hypothetical protein
MNADALLGFGFFHRVAFGKGCGGKQKDAH